MSDLVETYTVEEVAHALKLHPYTIRRLSREGKISAFKFGGQWRFKKEDIDLLLKKSKGGNG
ncbi:MAG: helix-turn-helix domain-containing protein [Proteobacteria bacterium]|nr:helix-turn-helix domain-containing protein [Pseudomonadota bacterium]